MIYGGRNPGDLRNKFETREDKYAIKEMASLSLGLDVIKEKINGYKAVVIGDIPSHERNLLLKYCFEKDIRCYSIPKLSDIMLRNADDIHLFDTTLLLSRNLRLTAEQLFFKRIVDIIFSLAGLVIASPFMILIALAIKLYDGGPVFYKQPRLTKDKQIFMILKFRSMQMDSEVKGAQLAKKEDDRITPVSYTHLDVYKRQIHNRIFHSHTCHKHVPLHRHGSGRYRGACSQTAGSHKETA